MSGNSNKNFASPIRHNGWVKHFTNGTAEYGWDNLVAIHKASWSKGQLSDIQSVSLCHGDRHICISGPGDYWQSDDFDVKVHESVPKYAVRRLERKLSIFNYAMAVYMTPRSVMLKVLDQRVGLDQGSMEQMVELIQPYKGMWLILEYNVLAGTTSWYFSKERI